MGVLENEVEIKEVREKKKVKGNQKNITYINDYLRFTTTMHDNEMTLEYKKEYDDGSIKWVHDGYFYSDISLVKAALPRLKNNRLKKKEISDMEHYIKCYKEAHDEIRKFFKL